MYSSILISIILFYYFTENKFYFLSAGDLQRQVSDVSIQELPDFLEGKGFLLYGDFEGKERRTLKRYVTAYGGWACIYYYPLSWYLIVDKGLNVMEFEHFTIL